MCYAIPGKVVSRDGDDGVVDYGGVKKAANLTFMPKAGVGDYVLVHAGFAIEKVDEQSAEESLAIARQMLDAEREGRAGARR